MAVKLAEFSVIDLVAVIMGGSIMFGMKNGRESIRYRLGDLTVAFCHLHSKIYFIWSILKLEKF